MGVVALRQQYGRRLAMIGGFDKRILASTPAAITREFERLRPVLEGGGYQLACDHGVPPDVPLANYAHLCGLLRNLR
jgi:uroporphyrinogen-III decarboxylase